MKKQHLFLWTILVLVILGTLACSEEPTGPRAWIDSPRDGAVIPAGAPVNVLSHVYAPDGVAEVLLAVNGVAYRRNPPTESGTFAKAAHEWFPDKEGDFVLEVTAFSTKGEASIPARAQVKVLGKGATPTLVAPAPATTVPSAPDLAIVSVEAVVAGNKGGVPFCNTRVTYRNAGTAAIPRDFVIQFHFNGVPTIANTVAGGLLPGTTDQIVFVYQFEGAPNLAINLDATNLIAESNEANNAFAEARLCGGTPAPTAPPPPTAPPTLVPRSPTPTATATIGIVPPGPAQVNFRADRTALTQGECTTLRWDVENATGVFLDGNGVAGHGSQSVCPNKTTTYNLHVTAPAGNVDRSVTISVQAAPATNTPTRTLTPTTPPDTTPPPIPQPQDPTGGKSVACSGATGSATLRWSSVSDPSGVTYYVKWSGGGQSGGWDGAGTSHGISIKCGYQYSWQVRACDGKGNCSNWSSSATFMAGTLH